MHDDSKLNFILKWSACIFTLCGATLTALNIDPYNIYILTVGGTLYLTWSVRIKEWNLIIVNIFMVLIYGFGTVLALLK